MIEYLKITDSNNQAKQTVQLTMNAETELCIN